MQKSSIYLNPTFQLANEGFFLTRHADSLGGLRAAGTSSSVRRNDWPDRRDWRIYPYYVLNIMLEDGRGYYRNEDDFHCQLSYGHFFFCFPNFKQLYGPGKGEYWNELFVNFKGDVFDAYHKQEYFHSHQPVWHLDEPTPWINRLRNLLRAPRPNSKRQVAAETSHFLGLLFEMMNEATVVGNSPAPSDWFEQACTMLTQNLRTVSLPEIAQTLGMSYPSFRIAFKQRANISPYQYREQRRIGVAREALINSPGKLCQEIAFSLGYSRGDHFATQFKRHTGLLPSEYRKKFARKMP